MVDSTEEICKLIESDAVIIPAAGLYNDRCINLAFSCSWDEENCVGLRLLNESVDEIGYKDIVF